jgi:hypothetical protein
MDRRWTPGGIHRQTSSGCACLLARRSRLTMARALHRCCPASGSSRRVYRVSHPLSRKFRDRAPGRRFRAGCHFLARWGCKRSQHRIEPGLYAIGSPTETSPVFVTSNYPLSFDALRSAIPGIDGYILVLDTKGGSVWCAAGKGTFGTDESVHRIEAARLKSG